MKKVILEIPSPYLEGDTLSTVLNRGFNFHVTSPSKTVHDSQDDELTLNFDSSGEIFHFYHYQ